MSAAAAAEAPPPAKGKKKLIIIIAAVAALVLVGGGGGAYFLMKKKAAVEADAEADGDAEQAADSHAPAKGAAKRDPKAVPVFVPLEAFTVNLADRDAERYAQIGITLEVEDARLSDQIKSYMPAIRNNILMAISDRTAAELLGREGKARLAQRVKVETSRALGFDVKDPDPAEPQAEEAAPKAEAKPGKKKKKKDEPVVMPIKGVHFSNFIIQ